MEGAHDPLDWASEQTVATGLTGPVDGPSGYEVIIIDPARVLAQVAAHRAIVELHHPYDHGGDHGDYVFCSACQWDHGDESPRVDMDFEQFGKPCPTLRALASIWADDPRFQEAWR